MAMPKSAVPIRFSALRARREELSRLEGRRLTQEDIADRTGEAISQRTVSHLEAGSIELGSIAASRLVAFAKALNWTLGELQEATGIDLAIERNIVPTPSETPPFPAPLYKRRDEVYMPEGLLDAIRQFGDVPEYAELKNPEVQRQLAGFRGFDGGPQTAGQWLAFFQANKPWLSTDN